MSNKLITLCAVALMAGLVIPSGFVEAETSPPAENGILPPINLVVPQSLEHQQYLGISGKETFTIDEIKAEIVLVEIFSMY